ncbi:MAG: hypothetical protein IPM74_03530 [Crocinitomicaceae bacterium]|nr:hypothetical protein [Crocinitomicaceae bacterium]MBK8924984.1 hypothetical protein [Crocinitomicaceae bacterium]
MKTSILVLSALFLQLTIISCKKEGCTDSTATNYNSDAKKDDGSCIYPEPEPDPRAPYLGSYLVTDSLFLNSSFSEQKIYTLQLTTGGTVFWNCKC